MAIRKWTVGVAVALVALLALTVASVGAAKPAQKAAPLKVALVTDIGGLNDKGFNALAYKGLKAAQKQGIDPSQIDPEKPVVIVVDDPNGAALQKAPMMALLPVGPQSQLGNMAMVLAGPQNVGRLDGGVSVVMNRPPLDDTHGAGLLRGLAQAPLAGDLELFLHAAAMKTRYSSEIAKFFDKMKADIEKPQMASGTKLDPSFARAYVDWLRGGVEAVQSLLVGFGAGESDLDLYFVSRGNGEAALPAESSSMPDLAQFVPASDIRLEMTGGSWKGFYDLAMKMYEGALKERPDLLTRLRATLDVWMKGSTQIAMSLQLDGERFLRGTAVMLSDRAGDQLQAMRDGVELMKDEAMQKMMRGAGSEFSITLQKEARKVEGWPVDHVSYTFKLDDSKLTGDAREMLQRVFAKPLEMEVARIGSYLVYTINESPAAFDKVVGELMSGKGSSPSLQARAKQPAGGWLYGDVDVPRLWRNIGSLLSDKLRRNLPQLDDRSGPATIFGYSPGSVGYYRLGVPTILVDSIRNIAARRGGGGNDAPVEQLPPPSSM